MQMQSSPPKAPGILSDVPDARVKTAVIKRAQLPKLVTQGDPHGLHCASRESSCSLTSTYVPSTCTHTHMYKHNVQQKHLKSKSDIDSNRNLFLRHYSFLTVY